MDIDFITELDVALSNVGSDQVWKRTLNGVELWISPLQVVGQEKVAEVITRTDLGSNIISESKRMTLAHAIVGINGHDLREYRGGAAVFPVTNKEGKQVKTTLDRYLYQKIGAWGAQFIDDTFSVYADLMESFQKENLKDIKFENAKDQHEELAELQARVYELRSELGLPMLVDPNDPKPEEVETAPEVVQEEQPGFNPFTVQQAKEQAKEAPREPVRQQVPVEITTKSTVPNGDPLVISPAAARRAAEAAQIELSALNPTDSPPVPLAPPPQSQPTHQITQGHPQPSPRDNIVDKPASRAPVPLPVIDKVPVSKNPRFSPPKR